MAARVEAEGPGGPRLRPARTKSSMTFDLGLDPSRISISALPTPNADGPEASHGFDWHSGSGTSSTSTGTSSTAVSTPATPKLGAMQIEDDSLVGEPTILDFLETFVDGHVDLWSRTLISKGSEWKSRTQAALQERKERINSTVAVPLRSAKKANESIEARYLKFRTKTAERLASLSSRWREDKTVRFREKVNFVVGVYNVLVSALLVGCRPEWVHLSYTIQAFWLIPYRIVAYKRKAWHYFTFDLCYYSNALLLLYLWVFPSSHLLFASVYLLMHGPVGWAVITWRNSLVFHSVDKVTSLFIHLYPPFLLTVLRHCYPPEQLARRFSALALLADGSSPSMGLYEIFVASLAYWIWQGSYCFFILNRRREKIKSGARVTSFSFLEKDTKHWIGKIIARIPPSRRTASFIFCQYIYALLSMSIACYLYHSKTASFVFLSGCLGMSAWNGAGFYLEVLGRKYEKELNLLRKQMSDEAAAEPVSVGGSVASGTGGGGGANAGFSSGSLPLATTSSSPERTASPLPALRLSDVLEPGQESAALGDSSEEPATVTGHDHASITDSPVLVATSLDGHDGR